MSKGYYLFKLSFRSKSRKFIKMFFFCPKVNLKKTSYKTICFTLMLKLENVHNDFKILKIIVQNYKLGC